MSTIFHDFRYAVRLLRRSPVFTVLAVLTLAVGIGANVAIFSYVDELWLRPMPVPQADRVLRIFSSNPSSQGEIEEGMSSYPDFKDLRANTKTVEIGLYQGRGAMLDDGVQNKLVLASLVSDNFFDVLQPSAAAGRTFTERELQSTSAPVVVLSYPFWRRQYNADPSIVGQTIIVDRHHVTVLGVLPRGFRGTAMGIRDLWIPVSTWKQTRGAEEQFQSRSLTYFDLFARLRDGASLAQAQAELSGMASQLARQYPDTNTSRKFKVLPETQTRGADIANLGVILLGVAGLVLLIACSNVASLLIARAEYRRHEIATRIALGARRGRIIYQALIETAMLALMGAIAALLLGNALLAALPGLLPRLSIDTGLDPYLSSRGIIVAFLVTLVSMLVFGITPAVLASRTSPIGALKQRGAEAGNPRSRVRSLLVVGQIALSLALVVGTGLLTRSLVHALEMDPGFNAHQQMLVIDFSPDKENTQNDRALVREARHRIEALPGAGPATVAMRIPFGASGSGVSHKVFVTDNGAGSDRDGVTIHYDPVADHFFDVLGTRILRGRAIDEHDLETNAKVAVVNELMASRFWPNDDAIGKRLRLDTVDGDEYVVIGIAENGKYNDFEESAEPYFFVPMRTDDYGEVCMTVKTAANAGMLANPVRKTLRELNPNLAILRLLTLHDHVRQALYSEQLMARLIAALGGLGLLLAAVGIYGLMSFLVGRRTQEIGIRLALGAQRKEVFRLIIRHAMVLTAIGVGFGAVAAFAASGTLKSLLVGVAPTDFVSFAAGVAILLLVALIATVGPAIKATHVDPLVALRDE